MFIKYEEGKIYRKGFIAWHVLSVSSGETKFRYIDDTYIHYHLFNDISPPIVLKMKYTGNYHDNVEIFEAKDCGMTCNICHSFCQQICSLLP